MKQNSMSGKIFWEAGAATAHIQEQKRWANRWYDLTVQRLSIFDSDEQAFWRHPQGDIVCSMIGYLTNIDELKQRHHIEEQDDVAIAGQLYSSKGIQGLAECDGLFLIALFNERNHVGYLTQSEYGMFLPMYYATDANGVYFGSSLKHLLQHSSSPRTLNHQAVKEFLHFEHIIPTASTLVQDVQKLEPRTYLRVDCEKREWTVRTLDFPEQTASTSTARQELLPSIESNIRYVARHLRHQQFTTTLTSGWDTNVMLFVLHNLTDLPITAVTIDGGQAQNELPATHRILQHYTQVRHLTSTIQPSIIEELPNMAWMLEGAVFENGIFLRYELGKLLAQHDLHAIFLGACADQIMYPETMFKRVAKRVPDIWLKEMLITGTQRLKDSLFKPDRWEERELRRKLTRLSSSVYSQHLTCHLDIEFLLKMHGLLFNGFGVQGVFPFLNRATAVFSKALGMVNRKKAWYKAQVREKLPPAITQHFQKSGAVVDAPRLVTANQTTLLRVLKTPLICELLPASLRQAIAERPLTYYKLLLQCAYLFLFHEFFVSGRFDKQFHNSQIAYSLSRMLEE